MGDGVWIDLDMGASWVLIKPSHPQIALIKREPHQGRLQVGLQTGGLPVAA